MTFRPEPRASRTDLRTCFRNANSWISLPATVAVSEADQSVTMIEGTREVTRVRIERSNSSTTLLVSMRTTDWVSAAHSAAGTRNRAKRTIDRQDIGTHHGGAMK